MNDERFRLLLEKHLEGSLSDAEARELAEAIEASPELRARMLDHVGMAGLLGRVGRPAEDVERRVLAALRDRADKEALATRILDRLPGRPPRSRRLLAAAAALALAAGLWLVFRPPAEPAGPAVALLESSGRPARPVRSGETVAVPAGAPALLSFPDGARLRLEGGAELRVDEVALSVLRGAIEADLPAVATDRRIATPHADVWAGASRLALRVEPDATRVEVREGQALLRRTSGPRLEVAAGQYAIVVEGREIFPAQPLVDPSDVRAAVERGVAYLRGVPLPSSRHEGPMGSEDLVLLTLLKAGVPPDDPFARALLDKMLATPLRRTYTVSLQAMALQALDAARFRARIAECAQFLVDNQCENGQWSYGKPTEARPEGTAVRATRSGPAIGNNSCTIFALMGLRACRKAGIAVPRETFERAAGWWRASLRADKEDEAFRAGEPPRAGWCYSREEFPHHPYASMTAGGLGSLILCHEALGTDWRRDPAARKGLGWLTHHFTVLENFGPVEELMAREILSDTPHPRTEFFYYLWAVERAAAYGGLERFGPRDWYLEGSYELLALQRPDGSWYSGVRRCDPVWDTCYAILFLTRSTGRAPRHG